MNRNWIYILSWKQAVNQFAILVRNRNKEEMELEFELATAAIL